MNFCHLHVHTKYSILDGFGSPEKYVEHAKELGMKSLAITDHGNVYGSYKFWKECNKQNIKPILGEEFYIVPNRNIKETREMFHLILLAKNIQGFRNLCRLSSLGFTEGFYYKPRIDYEILRQYKEGLICASACMFGQVAQLALNNKVDDSMKLNNWYVQLFGDDYYLEIMPHHDETQKSLNQYLLQLGTQCVVTNDCHYIRKEDEKYQAYLLKVQTSSVGKISTFEFGIKDLYLKTREEVMGDLVGYHQIEQSVAEKLCDMTIEITNKIENIEFDKLHKIPNFGGAL